jgi:23S rRNA (adenine2030-N6)-methyltransferase
LARVLGGDRRSKAIAIDGWTALNAYVPPPERRGLVVIDPPFEQPDDFQRLGGALEGACRKWATGSYLLWYPIKDRRGPDALARRLRSARLTKVLRAEVTVAASRDDGALTACGLIAVNPPWTLPGELAVMLPELVRVLSAGAGSGQRVDWLTAET